MKDKIRIVMEGIRGDISISKLCRRERMHTTVCRKWLKDFMEGGEALAQRGPPARGGSV